MQYEFGTDKVGVASDGAWQDDAARSVMVRSRDMVARGNLNQASDLLTQTLDNTAQSQPEIRAQLAVLLACVLATQGHLAAAERRLTPSLEHITDRRSAANICCARATELACEGDFEHALRLAITAERLATTDRELMERVEDLYAVIVPPLVLSETPTTSVPELLKRRVLSRLIKRFIAAPTQLHIAHTIALLAEQCAVEKEKMALVAWTAGAGKSVSANEVLADSHVGGDYWLWAIRCWVMLAFSETYWERWARQVEERRGNYEVSRVDLQFLGESAVTRMRELFERLRDIYRQPSSPLRDVAHAERYERYFVALETERLSAQALTDLTAQVPSALRSSGFVGPVAGVSLLAGIGRVGAIQHSLSQLRSVGTDLSEARAKTLSTMEHCLSPFSPMYTLHFLGKSADAEEYCRNLAAGNPEPRSFLGSLLCDRARAAFEGHDLEGAHKLCLETLKLASVSTEVATLFAKVGAKRVDDVLDANRTNFELALSLANEDLACIPSNRQLKKTVARVLRLHAQHLLNLLGNADPDLTQARRIYNLQAEAWHLDPVSDAMRWTIGGVWGVLVALLGKLENANAASFEEAERILTAAERDFPNEPSVMELRVLVLRSRVDFYLGSESRAGQLKAKPQLIEQLAADVERAWNLDTEHEDRSRTWTANSMAELASAYLPAEGWPLTLVPYDSGLSLVERALRLAPGHRVLVSTQAELLRLKASAIIILQGVLNANALSEANKRLVLVLFAKSWKLDDSVAQRALAMAHSCALIGEYAEAERYAHSALVLDSSNTEAQDVWARMHANPVYEAAAQDASYAEQLIEQRRYREAVGYLKRADQALSRSGYSASWDLFVELHRVVRNNLDVLRRSGFR